MKRFHVHLHVADLSKSIAFYSKMFAAAPARVEADYAKWMLDDPRLNFAISTRSSETGIDHLGLQTDDPAELATLRAQAEAADLALFDVGETTCCYAKSDKHWVTDPQGIAWEHFHTMGDIAIFREPRDATGEGAACCATATSPAAAENAQTESATPAAPVAGCGPALRGKPVGVPVKAAATSCC